MQHALEGKVAIVTGANTGIGKVTAMELAKRGAQVFLACRSEQRTQPVLEEIRQAAGLDAKVEFLPLDLGDHASVRRCAALFLQKDLPLHLLIANAGLAGQKGLTKSGFELAFGTCHVGHFLLTQLLLERMKSSGEPARVVVVASKAHIRISGIDFASVRKPTRTRSALPEYAAAKLANVMFAAELARRLRGTNVTAYSLHPGVVASDVWRAAPRFLSALLKPLMLSTEDGAKTSLYCATQPDLEHESGGYFVKCRRIAPSKAALDPIMAAELWEKSERWVAQA